MIIKCHSCGMAYKPLTRSAQGWINDEYRTANGSLRVVLCFYCRDLVPGSRQRAIARGQYEADYPGLLLITGDVS